MICLAAFNLITISSSFCDCLTKKSLSEVNKWFILLNFDQDDYAVSQKDVQSFEMAILDSDSHPDLSLFSHKTILIGYLSVGEAESYRYYWDKIKDDDFILDENPNWKDNYFVDIRSEKWMNLIVFDLIPRIIANGFDGIMLDTLDTAEYLEDNFDSKYNGAKKSLVGLIAKIRETYPELLIISNGGLSLMDDIAINLDAALIEDVNMSYDFNNKKYVATPKNDKKYKLSILSSLITKYQLPVFNIDYVSKVDKKNRRKLLKLNLAQGFKPYLAEKDLNEIYKF